jgi:hypothetical protein
MKGGGGKEEWKWVKCGGEAEPPPTVDRSTAVPNLDLRERWRGEKGKGKMGILGLNGG